MKISDLIEKLDLKLITRPDNTDKEVTVAMSATF